MTSQQGRVSLSIKRSTQSHFTNGKVEKKIIFQCDTCNFQEGNIHPLFCDISWLFGHVTNFELCNLKLGKTSIH